VYALYFSGTEEEDQDPTWLTDKQGRVIVFLVEDTAKLVRRTLYSGEEEISVLPFDKSTDWVNSEFEERYLKAWRYQ
jgi:hypothetical protein